MKRTNPKLENWNTINDLDQGFEDGGGGGGREVILGSVKSYLRV